MNIRWNDTWLDVKCRVIPYLRDTHWEPSEGGDVEIDAIWTELKDKDGKTVEVDVLPLISEADYEEIEDLIWNEAEESKD